MIFSDIRVKDIYAILHYTPQAMKFTAKNRNSHIIGIQLSGSAEHTFEDKEFLLDENCLYFFNQAENYKVKVLEKGVCFSVHFTTYEPITVGSFCIKIKENSAFVNGLRRIEQQYTDSGECTVRVLSELYKVLGDFEDVYQQKYLPKNTKIQTAKEYINLHLKEKGCIANAAKQYGVTVRRFNDIFKQNFHITPNHYIINQKIGLSKKLLCSNELAVGDIANLCGFEDVYYFSKTFKKITGQTPREFRKQGKIT